MFAAIGKVLGAAGDVENGDVEDVVPDEITDIILEETKLPTAGVTVAYLSQFVTEHGDRLREMSIANVQEMIVQPLLEEHHKSTWCEVLQENPSSAVSSMVQPESTWFVCCSSDYLFLDLVDALLHSASKPEYSGSGEDIVLWLSIFSSPLSGAGEARDATWWASVYGNTIASVPTLMLVMQPWDAPLSLHSAKCVYELYASDVKKCRLDVALTPSEADRCFDMIGGNNSGVADFMKHMAAFRSEACQLEGRSESENKGLADAFADASYEEVDVVVYNMLERWLVGVLRKQIDFCGRNSQVEAAAQWMNTLGGLFRKKGKFDLAEPLLLSCLEIRKRNLGDQNVDTLTSMNNLAGLYKAQGKNTQAETLYVTCLQGRQAVLGDDHPNTLGTMNNLAGVYKNQGKFHLAEPFYVSCLESTKKVLGEVHPDTLTSMNNLALLYRGMGMLEKAEPLYLACLEGRTQVLGSEHPDTLGTMNNLALLFDDKGDYDSAEPLYQSCLDIRVKVLGNRHPDALQR